MAETALLLLARCVGVSLALYRDTTPSQVGLVQHARLSVHVHQIANNALRAPRRRAGPERILYLAALHEPFAEPKGMCGKDSNAHGAV